MVKVLLIDPALATVRDRAGEPMLDVIYDVAGRPRANRA